MNLLQSLSTPETYCVTLNDTDRIDPSKILKTIDYAHPTFSVSRKAMQARHVELLGPNQTSFCGAYWANGFHEDGVRSALAVVEQLREALDEG